MKNVVHYIYEYVRVCTLVPTYILYCTRCMYIEISHLMLSNLPMPRPDSLFISICHLSICHLPRFYRHSQSVETIMAERCKRHVWLRDSTRSELVRHEAGVVVFGEWRRSLCVAKRGGISVKEAWGEALRVLAASSRPRGFATIFPEGGM